MKAFTDRGELISFFSKYLSCTYEVPLVVHNPVDFYSDWTGIFPFKITCFILLLVFLDVGMSKVEAQLRHLTSHRVRIWYKAVLW